MAEPAPRAPSPRVLGNGWTRAAALACVVAAAACDTPRLTLRQMCIRECEQTGRTFEAVERCRSDCREAYEADTSRRPSAPADAHASHAPVAP